MQDGNLLGVREKEHDDFLNYRQNYPGKRGANNTWKYRIESFARLLPDRIAMIQGERRLTWDKFNRESNRLAHGLLDMGVKKEDRVAISGFNSIEWMEIYFAASKIGAVPTNINPRYVTDEIRYILEDSDAVVLFVEDAYADNIIGIIDQLPALDKIVIYGVGRRPLSHPENILIYDDIKGSDEENPDIMVYNDDFSFLMYTGGTTGYPKGTVWDGEQRVHGLDMILVNAMMPVIDRLHELPEKAIHGFVSFLTSSKMLIKAVTWLMSRRITRSIIGSRLNKNIALYLFKMIMGRPRIIKLLSYLHKDGVRMMPACPLFHGAAFEAVFSFIGALGGTIVFLPTSHPFKADEFWEIVEREKVLMSVIVGDAFAIPLINELKKAETKGDKYNTDSFWIMASSGVRWSPHVKKEMLDHIPGMLALDEMGTSESSGGFSEMAVSGDENIKMAGAMIPALAKGLYKKQVFPSRVIDPETGSDVEPGSEQIGEFLYGGWMALGYWKCPQKTAADFRMIDGKRWFFVGDEGKVDENGKFNLIGRGGGYMINTGGEKVYSEEVEGIIKTNPDVIDTVVIGVADPRWGAAVTALIKMSKDNKLKEDDIIDHCRSRMAGYKRPKNIIFVDDIPRTAAGKVDRIKALSIASDKLNIESA
uniref:AMP-dependent synthetase and ligase n=1 Tax=uncultured delta proteobacterium TaxID=34034 RepID=Q2YZS0_9DELT|nr:hypothetical protein [uncultured delta proteobacterium]